MKEVLERLNRKLEAQKERKAYYENARDNCARGSAKWRENNEIAERYHFIALGIEIAIVEIERAQVKNELHNSIT